MGEKDEMNRTCGNCRHWHKMPKDPMQLNVARGNCRESPPAGTAIISQSAGGAINVIAWAVAYPPVEPDFPACSRYAAKLEAQIDA
jgi:hypothetical protein